MANDTQTPMMAQFRSLKSKHPDAILLFRCGDFYETYQEDAVLASSILGITLTHRNNKGNAQPKIEMAGFPHHALDTYLPKLIRAGHRVAICDQLEDPKLTKKLVRRGITELVTPGVVLSDNVLESKQNNFLAALNMGRGTCGMSLLDVSTGEFAVAEGSMDYMAKLIMNFQPKEVLVIRGSKEKYQRILGQRTFTFELDEWVFNEKNAVERLCRHFNVKNLKGFGIAHMETALTAAGAILYYLEDTRHTHISHITSLKRIDEDRYVRMDNFTLRNLEVTVPLNEGGNSLLDIIDKTVTPMGGRMLRRWLSFPLCDINDIKRRQDCVEYLYGDVSLRESLIGTLQPVGDMERLISKAAVGRINPREMQQLRHDMDAVASVRESCLASSLKELRKIGEGMDACIPLRDRIANTLQPNPPILTSKGGYIADGVSKELDELRQISQNSRQYLADLQEREAQRTGIQSLKIGFNNVFGYYLEVRNTFKDHVPNDWVRKQTLVNAERYITQELKEYEEKILGAEEKILLIESTLFRQLVDETLHHIDAMQKDAAALAVIDCFLSMAAVAEERKYIRPIIDDTTQLDIRQGRHPVIETQMEAGETYVPNDVCLDTDKQQIIIITGPNMAGKSALLRQTALIVLLAQVGSYVPAESARIGVVDKIFTRVGASDNISRGESTFMVEMSEAASIMNSFTERSLVLFDELGRGTSTYDGISIAWSIVEYLHENSKGHPRTLFATHYHELNEMEKTFPRIHNYNVSVKEIDHRIIFLRKLVKGGSAHSFGIHVAQIAGMPPSIVKRADRILEELEKNNSGGNVSKPTREISQSREGMQLNFFQLDDPVLCQIRDRIVNLNINSLTPIEALNILNDIKNIVQS